MHYKNFMIDLVKPNHRSYRRMCVWTSLRKKFLAMQVRITVKVSQYISQDGFLNSALCFYVIILHYYQYHNSIRVAE